jgi:hypothetical protein
VLRRFFHWQLPTRFDALPRDALLEKLLARADPVELSDWRLAAYDALGAEAPMPPLAAVARRALDGIAEPTARIPADSWVWIASPVHYLAELDHVRLAPDGVLSLDQAQADAWATSFNALWREGGVRLEAVAGELYLYVQSSWTVPTVDPDIVRGRRIEAFLPAGEAAKPLKTLMSEVEMWLFAHPLNRARSERGEPPLTGLWFWGGGAVLPELPVTAAGAVGDDRFFRGFAAATDRASVCAWSAVPGSAQIAAAVERWLKPSLHRLARGEVAEIILSAADRGFALPPRWRWRMLRKTKPWWEYFE